MIFHILVEGSSDEPAVDAILRRRFGMVKGSQYRIYPHAGRGRLPDDPTVPPSPLNRTLLHQLPAKLRAFSRKGPDTCVVVLLDQDDDDCRTLLGDLLALQQTIQPYPPNVLYRIAMEELEAWFLADAAAIQAAYPNADLSKIPVQPPDEVDDPSDRLAEVLNVPLPCSGADKFEWAKRISPKIKLRQPASPSLKKFIDGIQRYWPV